ncbi:MAG: glycogen debranching enzyme, partial [Acetivibrio ethanolgignens]
NGKYRDDIRRFLKGDNGMAQAAALRIAGSHDIYDPMERQDASINFLTCHDGFTLYDLYSYNEKHNEKNGWNNTDGANDNNSWNCGVEGTTEDVQIKALRFRMIRNACAVLLLSRGTPMFLAGDEFGNTQFGNNNPYCQDNEISWLDWELLEKNRELFKFFQHMIRFRKEHPILRKNLSNGILGFPDISFHGTIPWSLGYMDYDHYIGVMFAGQKPKHRPEIIYIALNSYWEEVEVTIPPLPKEFRWNRVINTWKFAQNIEELCDNVVTIPPRTVEVFEAFLN